MHLIADNMHTYFNVGRRNGRISRTVTNLPTIAETKKLSPHEATASRVESTVTQMMQA